MVKHSVKIIIINWNGYEDTVELLNSLSEITYTNFSVLLLDNFSSGDDYQKLQRNFGSWIQVICTKENLGFAGGNNYAIRQSIDDADYILLLNNDTIVEPDFLDHLVNKLSSDPRIGVVSPKINYYADRKKIWSAGGPISRLRSSGFTVENVSEDSIGSEDRKVEFVSGCCMLFKTEVLKRVGLFDENFFLYIEDADLCYRTIKAGYKIFAVTGSKIYHKVAASSKNKVSVTPVYYGTRNRLYFAKKNFGWIFYPAFTYILVTMIIKSVYWTFTGKTQLRKAVVKSFNDFLSGKMGKQDLR